MTFPGAPETALLIDGIWTDVSGDVYDRDPVRISHGGADEGSGADVSTCSFTLNNRDGKYSPRNPRSPLYGKIGRNTPVRVSVYGGESYVQLDGDPANNVSTPDHSSLDLSAGLDLRAEVSIDWRVRGGNQTLIGKWDGPGNQRSYMLRVHNSLSTPRTDHRLTLSWSADGTSDTAAFVFMPIHTPPRRFAVRATLNPTTGVIELFTAPSLDGPWTLGYSHVTTPEIATVFNSNLPLKVGPEDSGTNPARRPFIGYGHRFEVRNGVNGPVVAAPDFRNLTPGTTSFTDSAGKVWTVNGTASVSNRHTRFEGEISSWPARWEPSGNDVWVPIEAAGIRRRLGQGVKALASTLSRAVPGFAPLAYWPMEDGADAVQAYSPIEGVSPLKLSGVDWAIADSLPSSNALPVLAADLGVPILMSGRVPPPPAGSTSWQVRFVYRNDEPDSTLWTFMRILSTSGTVREWFIQSRDAGSRIIGLNADGGTVVETNIATSGDLFNQWVEVRFRCTQNGGNVDWRVDWQDVGGDAGGFGSSFAGTLGPVSEVASPSGGYAAALNGMAIGHISVWPTSAELDAYGGVVTAYSGETANERLERLCEEEGIPAQIGSFGPATAMGPQFPTPLLALLDECEAADGGMLADSREGRAVWYRGRETLYNQSPRLQLDYASGREVSPSLEPVEDDQHIRNDVTRSRPGGSSARVVASEGPLSVLPPEQGGVGTYDEALTVNVASDDQLPSIAAWSVHLGTWDEARYPVVNMRLHAAPHLIPNVLNLELLDRADILNPPEWVAPGDIRLLVRGYEEYLTLTTWDLSLNCSPAGPWEVGVAGSEASSDNVRNTWADTAGSAVAQNVTATETLLPVLTTTGPVWTGDHFDTPLTLDVGGEHVTVVATGKVINGNALLTQDISGWAADAGTSVAESTAVVNTLHGAARSILATPAGGAASSGVVAAHSGVGSVVAGVDYTVSAWIYSPAGWSDMRVSVYWYNAAGTFLSTTVGSVEAIPAGEWTFITALQTAPTNASQARVRIRQGANPAATDIYYVWAARMTLPTTGAAADYFTRTVSNGWGSTTTGQAWSLSGTTSNFAVGSGYGSHTHTEINVALRSTLPSPGPDTDLYCDIAPSVVATGASLVGSLTSRLADAVNMYMARVVFETNGTVQLSMRRRTAGSDTILGTAAPGLTYSAGQFFRLRFQTIGSTLRAKVWAVGTPEPSLWHVEATDTGHTAAGEIGVRSFRTTSNSNASAQLRFDNFLIANPQSMTVERSVNAVVKEHNAGANVQLAYPTFVAL